MTRGRRVAAVVACALVGSAWVISGVATPSARAETGVDVAEVCRAPSGAAPLGINLLILLDTSRSLDRTDPTNLRSSGTSRALEIVESLGSRFPDTAIEVTLDTFDERYSRQEGWHPATEIYTRVGDSIEVIASDDGRYTDYAAALRGAWRRFSTRTGECNLLIWFTDGEHATESGEQGEQRELSQLCNSSEMRSLREHVWVGAVLLREGDADADAGWLRYLYGEESPADSSLDCTSPLRGRIYDSFDGRRLDTVLRELIERGVDPWLLLPDEFVECSGGDGSPSRPCAVSFDLDSGIESFRAFADLTLINREIANPDLVLVAVESPDGTASPPIGALGEIRPREWPGSYLQVNPFGFFTRSNYPSDLQIVGHQAAEQLTNSNQWQWQWEGEWSVLFFGNTPTAQEDARRAAAAVRVQREDSPVVDSFGIDDRCSVSGFVANYPTDEYSDIELRLRVDAGDGQPIYPTRQSLTAEPLAVAQDTRRFALPGIFGELVSWDGPDQGGNGTNLRDALTQRGGIALVAVLSQTFTYAGAPEPLVWARDIGRLDLTERQASHLLDVTDGRSTDPLFCLPPDPGIRWLPTEVTLGDPQHDWSGAGFAVSAVTGEIPATLSLAAAGIELVEQDSDTGSAAVAGVAVGNAEWICEVPAAEGGADRFTCPEPISIEVSADQPFRPTMKLGIPLTITESPGSVVELLERLGHEEDSAGYGARSNALAEALERERRSVLLAAELDPVIDPDARWLPSNLEMRPISPPAGTVDVESVLVSVSPGRLPARMDLQSVRFHDEDDGASRDATGAVVGRWACTIPGSATGGGTEVCPDPVTVHIPPERDVELSLVLMLCAADEPEAVDGLLARSGVPAGTPDFEKLRRLIGALEREHLCEKATITVPRPPENPLLEFLPMLAALIAAAAAVRFWVAWRLRPWQPLGSSDYAVLPLDGSDPDDMALPAPDPSHSCMELQQRKSAASIEGVQLRSRWAPLLRGGEPELRASSAIGDCIGPAGHKRRRRHGRAEAVIGPDLERRWAVHDTDHDPRVIVWDLPFDDDDTRRDRIADAVGKATKAWESHRASVPESSDTADAADATGTDPAASDQTEPHPAPQTPFFDDADHRPGDDGQDRDDADPFGRDR
jgi:hypothetical protein